MINGQQNYMTNNNNSNPYSHAAAAYGNVQSGTMSGFAVTAELYGGMIKFVGQAKTSYEAGRLDDMCLYIQKTNKILMALQSNLNFEEGGQASIFLNSYYTDIFAKLFRVLKADDPLQEFDDVQAVLAPVRDLWIAHAENAKRPDPGTHVDLPEVDFSRLTNWKKADPSIAAEVSPSQTDIDTTKDISE